MSLRDLDIQLATLLGHYRPCNPNGKRAFYQPDLSQKGGSMAMGVFEKPIPEKLQFTEPDSCFEKPERRWWQSDINPDMWFTSAVPLYSTNIVETMKIVNSMTDKIHMAIFNIGKHWHVKIEGYMIYSKTFESMESTLELAICRSLVQLLEYKKMKEIL
jgi:hypothetical protein